VRLFEMGLHLSERPRIVRKGGVALLVRKTKRKGHGVFATTFIPRGTFILNIEGQRLRAKDVPDECLAMQIEDELFHRS